MISNFTVISVPQWAIFTAITVIIYGWAERKKAFGIVGSAVFAALGIFAAWVIYAGLLVPESLFDTRETMGGEELFMPDELPMEGRMLPFYWGMVINSVVALAAIVAEAYGKRTAGILKIAACGIGLLIFFGMLGAARM